MEQRKCEILLYTSYLHVIGGIETFIYNFIELMDSYDIGVYCPKIPEEVEERIWQKAKLFKGSDEIKCDKLIMIRMMDEIPVNVSFKRSIRMCHATKFKNDIQILNDCDDIVHVSEASKKSFKSDGEVILNPLLSHDKKEALLLVSATRIPALDKGENAARMLKLAEMFRDAKINFIWLNFSDRPLNYAPLGFVNVGHFQDLEPYIKRADYMVQLSDHEGFGYSVLEALTNKTAVICTPFETTKELGVVDGYNGYIIPFDMDFDVKKLLKVPRFFYEWDNDLIEEQWHNLLEKEPEKKPKLLKVKVKNPFNDIVLHKRMMPGRLLYMERGRAEKAKNMGLVDIV
jgi:glycosyltransferase involved in cell wall biosynthesis